MGRGGQLRGLRQLMYGVEDVVRAVDAGIRSFLIADIGLLVALRDLQRTGELPEECVWKISVSLAPSNPAALRVLADLGASTVNVPSDLTYADLAEMRRGHRPPPRPLSRVVRRPRGRRPGS
ncbi:hypothetical protein [Streptosporangium vulgare]|uniref:hypothetical protein n=1 Tax=Streptosporangium vulgare TaxID=46190 RepID=UPI0031E196CF